MHIIDFPIHDRQYIHQAAQILTAAFTEHWPNAWPNLDAALEEVSGLSQPDILGRAALDDDGALLGWAAARREYDGHAWELHPLAVRPDQQGRGIGRALVRDLEQQVAKRGGRTLYLGTDDEDGMTSLSGRDLYPDVAAHLAHVINLRRHPFEFYQKQGFAIVGVIPDANGPGKPDILMAKRVGVGK